MSRFRTSTRWWALAGCVAAAAAHAPAWSQGDRFAELPARPVMQKPAALERPAYQHRLVVKFRDELGVRVRAGRLEAWAPIDDVRGINRANAIEWRQLIDVDDQRLDALEIRAAARTGRRPIDLRSMLVVDAPEADLERIAQELLALNEVEWVDFECVAPVPPPCFDISPPSGSLLSGQTYFGPNPGIDMTHAWMMGNGRGAGVAFADIEYNARFGHEDLCFINIEPGVVIPAFAFGSVYIDHGTAVLGMLHALDNAYGVSGLVPDSAAFFFPEWDNNIGQRRAAAISSAAATLGPGDVILLEMQTIGPTGIPTDYAPAEYDLPVWTATRAAADAGLIIFAAAGNGSQDLDSPLYHSYRSRGHSGAIMVGAGSADFAHQRLSFSNFGSRVDLQGWGQTVFTAGYGDLVTFGGDLNQTYTHTFGGTSSATPMVAAAGISLQDLARNGFGVALDAPSMRQLLFDTGWPQTGLFGNIGPFPDLAQARMMLPAYLPQPCFADITAAGVCMPGTGDGIVDLSDFSCYLSLWSLNAPFADITTAGACNPGFGGDGVDLSDFSCYLAQWSLGCP